MHAGLFRTQQMLGPSQAPTPSLQKKFMLQALHAVSERACVKRPLVPLQVINIPNSMTVLPELLPYSIEMVRSMPWNCYSRIPVSALGGVLPLVMHEHGNPAA